MVERDKFITIPNQTKGRLNRRNFVKLFGASLLFDPEKALQVLELDHFLGEIQAEKELWQAIITENDLFEKDFKKLSREKALADFDMYFPMYKAGERKYGVDFKMLWVTHIHESTSSSDKNQNIYPFKGCMQRNTTFFKDNEPIAAGKGWEYLALLDSKGQADWMEILWGASHMEETRRNILGTNPELIYQPKILLENIFKKYCREVFAVQRKNQVLKLESVKEEFSNPT